MPADDERWREAKAFFDRVSDLAPEERACQATVGTFLAKRLGRGISGAIFQDKPTEFGPVARHGDRQ